jgi:hypothetical protein
MMNLMEGLEYIRAYIDDLLVITRGSLEDHLEKLREVLRRLRDAGLKVNAAKSYFCTHEIEYLGYILTRDGIKPQTKKVQAILALNPPNNVKELRHFLGMVQYYRDMWAKRSEMLAPLSDLVEECGETKTNRKNKVKPCHWDSIHQIAFDNVKSTIAKEVVLTYPHPKETIQWANILLLHLQRRVIPSDDASASRMCIPVCVPVYSGPHFPEFRIFRGISGFRRNTRRN